MINTDFDSTMHEIDEQDKPNRNIREDLKMQIVKLKSDISFVQLQMDQSDLDSMGQISISPERANERHKDMVFLKKDLAKRRFELSQLDQ